MALPLLNGGTVTKKPTSGKFAYWLVSTLVPPRPEYTDEEDIRRHRGRSKDPEFMDFRLKLFRKLDLFNSLIGRLIEVETGIPVILDHEKRAAERAKKRSEGSMLGSMGLLGGLMAIAANFAKELLQGLISVVHTITKKIIQTFNKVLSDVRKTLTKFKTFVIDITAKIFAKLKKTGKSIAGIFSKVPKPFRRPNVLKTSTNTVGKLGTKFKALEALGPQFSKFFSLLKVMGKSVPLLGALITPVMEMMESNKEIKMLIRLKDEDKIDEDQFRARVAQSIGGALLDAGSITMGASVGASLGLAAAPLVAALFGPAAPVGAILSVVGGATLGAIFGQFISDSILKPAFSGPLTSLSFAYADAESAAAQVGVNFDKIIKSLTPEALVESIGKVNSQMGASLGAVLSGIQNSSFINSVTPGDQRFSEARANNDYKRMPALSRNVSADRLAPPSPPISGSNLAVMDQEDATINIIDASINTSINNTVAVF